jgi:DNA-binding FadR family transcriptional regulator
MATMTSNPCSEFFHPSLAEAVAGHLRKLILLGVFDDRLPGERELASMFNVSRPSMRLALAALAAEGVLERGHGKPTRILVTAPCEVDVASFI